MVENWITIWLDHRSDLTVVGSDRTTHLALCKIDPYLITFRNSNECIDYTSELQPDENKVILIISSDSYPDILLKITEELSQIDSIYVLYSNETDHQTFENLSKIHAIYTDLEALCSQLRLLPNIKRNRRQSFLDDDFIINSLPHISDSTAFGINDTIQLPLSPSTDSTKRQEAEFMYGQFLRDILVTLESTEEEMIDFCRHKFAGNQAELNVVDEFQEYYDACNAIFWYTRDTFLYRLLNKALREQDVDTLYSLRYFIKDLHLQLTERHTSQQQTTSNISNTAAQTIETVYRGQLMNSKEFDKKVRNNTNGFFSVSSFLSTTAHKELAIVYAGGSNSNGDPTVQRVLFQIDIDKSVNKFPYANISTVSAFDEAESEILFTMGSVFRVQEVQLNSQGIWVVNLSLTGEEDEELKTLSEHMKKDIIVSNPRVSLAKLMMEIANYEKAEQFHLLLLQDLTLIEDSKVYSTIYNSLGLIYREMGQHTKAIDHYEKSLEIRLKHLSETDHSFAPTYNNMGLVYRDRGDYEKALSYFHKALEIELNAPDSDRRKTATYYNNI
ncbi:unnamed protein product [Rotaria sordida]|uniref:Tetratricopeptide repeat protein n=1 Tax=Rotaria sordida TaxID=392033 RepID=A0A819TRX5_9BILA|nr:unnamed protein product [Rotaria sordida]CAF1492443.1 unnamed protein product [Rotaria sordida]CAF4071865.1 unnamed protein product [Rotaria sordida]CAF4079574.1 unnamed protein product [Rotaria sordida]